MTIIINGRYKTRPVTGVERYAEEITRRIPDADLVIPSPIWAGGRGHLWEQLILPARVRAGDVLFSPANTGPLMVRNQIVTIHDLSPLDHPEWFARGFALWYRLLWPALARRVEKILTVSEFSRDRIMARLGISPKKVIAIPNGVDTEQFHPATKEEVSHIRKKYGLEKEYLLFVGSLQPRKNLPRLLQVWEMLAPQYPDVELVIAGATGPQFTPSHPDFARSIESRFFGYIPDVDLPVLYSAALALVHPSLYEGSGLTLLEAMACGCPVAAANNTALPEVVGRAGLLFDPFQGEQIGRVIQQLLEHPALREKMRSAGLERVKAFGWRSFF